MRLFKRFITGALRTFVEYCGCGDFQLLSQLAGLGFTNHPPPPRILEAIRRGIKLRNPFLGFYEGRGVCSDNIVVVRGRGVMVFEKKSVRQYTSLLLKNH